MAVTKKSRAVRLIKLVLALSVLAGGYQVWERIGVRSRPWYLEAYLESRLGDCRTGPGAIYFRMECEQLTARAEEVKQSLLGADRTFRIWRDYSVCVPELLSVCEEAELLRLKLALRQEEQKVKLAVLLTTLKHEFENGYLNGKPGPKPRMRSIEESRARSLVEQAEYLRNRGEVESALEESLRAWVAWQSYNHLVDRRLARFDDVNLRREWDQQSSELLQWTRRSGRRAILVDKLAHVCLLLGGGQVEKSYSASLSRNWYARKLQEHDAATPEGKYRVTRMIASGRYGMALLLDYPNAADRERFAASKRDGALYSNARVGGSVEIHGAGRPDSDWTDGCVSLSNEEMRDLYRHAYRGMPVTIVGTSSLSASKADGIFASR